MVDTPLHFKSKSQLLGQSAVPASDVDNAVGSSIEPSTCIESEPYALQVLDDSMAPEFWSGCVILIDPTGRATDGSFVLASVASNINAEDDGYVFRQLHKQEGGAWVLVALNTSYADTVIGQQLDGVVGVIVQRAGKRRSQHKRYD